MNNHSKSIFYIIIVIGLSTLLILLLGVWLLNHFSPSKASCDRADNCAANVAYA